MEWISVEDELPKDKYFLMYLGNLDIEEFSKMRIGYISGGEFVDDLWECTSLVTHWIPLPEPPKV